MKIQVLGDGLVRSYGSDAGADLFSAEAFGLEPMERRLVKTGVHVAIPDGFVGYVCSRSGFAHRNGVVVLNAPGVVDAGYRGEVMVNLINLSSVAVEFGGGARIAQLIVAPIALPTFIRVTKNVWDQLDSERGENGHGSTGA